MLNDKMLQSKMPKLSSNDVLSTISSNLAAPSLFDKRKSNNHVKDCNADECSSNRNDSCNNNIVKHKGSSNASSNKNKVNVATPTLHNISNSNKCKDSDVTKASINT